MAEVRAFVQARMSSARYPGKVLAPLHGRPVISHVLSRLAQALPPHAITLATSVDATDDPLAVYVERLGYTVCRGSLTNTVDRFQQCLTEFPCRWFFRVCADSPWLDPADVAAMMTYTARTDLDLVTNIYPRRVPHGQSVELLNAVTFSALDAAALTREQQEHATKVYYDAPDRFRIVSLPGADREGLESLAVDTVEDLQRLARRAPASEVPVDR